MKISQLVENMATVSMQEDCLITGLSSNSQAIEQGDCFFALQGLQTDGRHYIAQALEKGAAAVVVDSAAPVHIALPVPLICVPALSYKLGEIAARFYQHPSHQLDIIGVTGTSGKTSISHHIATAMQMGSKPCGVIGTLGYGFVDHLSPSTHTTCDALTLQRQLADLHQQGAQAVAMEVSSHALDQHRTAGVAFDTAIFTNLTRDHLDYHGTMENYAAAKRRLFYTEGLRYAVINTDDPFGVTLAQELEGKLDVYCYGLQQHALPLPTIHAHHIHLNHRGITAKVTTPWGEGSLRSKLLGRFNLSNLLAVLTTLHLYGVSLEAGCNYIEHLSTVAGRMQVFGGGKLPTVVVDYAHKPDALMQVLMALREHTHGTLWCVFGCGGDRDQGKRPLMAQIAERFADQLVITDDNPRTEDATRIVADIVAGLLCPWAIEIEHDRGAAIAHVISCAHPGDVVLVAGKGHEDYQIIGTERIAFSDSEHVQAQLRARQKNM